MCSTSVSSRSREKKRDDGKWRDYDRYYDRSDLYRDKSSWRRGRSKSRSKSRGLSRSRSRSRGRSKDHDGSRSAGEYLRCCFRTASPASGVGDSYMLYGLGGCRWSKFPELCVPEMINEGGVLWITTINRVVFFFATL